MLNITVIMITVMIVIIIIIIIIIIITITIVPGIAKKRGMVYSTEQPNSKGRSPENKVESFSIIALLSITISS